MPVVKWKVDTSSPAAPMEWVGWHRPPGGQWQTLCDGSTYAEAWRALLDEVGTGKTGEWVVLCVGRRP